MGLEGKGGGWGSSRVEERGPWRVSLPHWSPEAVRATCWHERQGRFWALAGVSLSPRLQVLKPLPWGFGNEPRRGNAADCCCYACIHLLLSPKTWPRDDLPPYQHFLRGPGETRNPQAKTPMVGSNELPGLSPAFAHLLAFSPH